MIKDCHRNGLSGYLGVRIDIYVYVKVIPAQRSEKLYCLFPKRINQRS